MAGSQSGLICWSEHSCLPSASNLGGPTYREEHVCKILSTGQVPYPHAPNQIQGTGSSLPTRGDAPKVRMSTAPGM